MTNFYPLCFIPQYQYRIWGGNKFSSELGRSIQKESIGESWEISTLKGFESEVAKGGLKGKLLSELIEEFPKEMLGQKVISQFGKNFPLLIKFIDAHKPLSVQVHPNDAQAQKRHNSFGKNEMWYVLNSDPDAELIVGFNQELDQRTYNLLLEEDRLEEVLNREKVSPGTAIYIPSGTIHAIGEGILLVEIQQSSDLTYRVYDYNRVDLSTGKKRELHHELALETIDFFTKNEGKIEYSRNQNRANSIIETPYFTTHYFPVEGTFKRAYQSGDSFKIYIGVEGDLKLTFNGDQFSLQYGQTLFIPAIVDQIEISGNGAYLEVFI